MQLNKDNAYPQEMYRAGETTLIFTDEQHDMRLQEGWADTYQKVAYPKWIPTGKEMTIKSEYDGGEMDVPEYILVRSEAEEKSQLDKIAKAKAKDEAAEPAKRGPGRPRVEEVVSA